jgi:hypothetical protein
LDAAGTLYNLSPDLPQGKSSFPMSSEICQQLTATPNRPGGYLIGKSVSSICA